MIRIICIGLLAVFVAMEAASTQALAQQQQRKLYLDYAAAAFNHSCASRVETPAEPPSRPSRIGAVEGIV